MILQMRQRFGDDWARIAKLSIIEETASGEKTVRPAGGQKASLGRQLLRWVHAMPSCGLCILTCTSKCAYHAADGLPHGRCAWRTWRSLPPRTSTAWPRSTLVSGLACMQLGSGPGMPA